jgi:hypothetical protein
MGILDRSKAGRKARIRNDFKNQQAYRENIQAVVGNQPVFDARIFDEREKDGKFKPQSKNKNLCRKTSSQCISWSGLMSYHIKHLCGGSEKDLRLTSTLHTTKGSVVSDADYASQIYTTRRMSVTSAMDVWKKK